MFVSRHSDQLEILQRKADAYRASYGADPQPEFGPVSLAGALAVCDPHKAEWYPQAASDDGDEYNWPQQRGPRVGGQTFHHPMITPATTRARFLTGETMRVIASHVNDVLLIGCIVALGIFALTAVHTIRQMEQQLAEQARV